MPDTSSNLTQPTDTLAGLRAELDQIDDALHDLLMQRASVVERLTAVAAKGRVALRPGREATIIQRLLARHHGDLPRRVLPRIWRELFAATTAMQGPYVIAVADSPTAGETHEGGHEALAREHFGASTDLRIHSSPTHAIGDVSSGAAIAAVLPMPTEDDDPRNAWWTALLQNDAPRIHIVARLPFWSPRAEGATQARALVVSTAAPDPSPHDHSLIGLEVPADMSRGRITAMFAEAGLPALGLLLRRVAGDTEAMVLAVVDGFVADNDPRLDKLASPRKAVVLGAYAKPVGGEPA
jgi:chorismate mutase/prephenate dehydratase